MAACLRVRKRHDIGVRHGRHAARTSHKVLASLARIVVLQLAEADSSRRTTSKDCEDADRAPPESAIRRVRLLGLAYGAARREDGVGRSHCRWLFDVVVELRDPSHAD